MGAGPNPSAVRSRIARLKRKYPGSSWRLLRASNGEASLLRVDDPTVTASQQPPPLQWSRARGDGYRSAVRPEAPGTCYCCVWKDRAGRYTARADLGKNAVIVTGFASQHAAMRFAETLLNYGNIL